MRIQKWIEQRNKEKGLDWKQDSEEQKSAVSTKDIKFKDFYPNIIEDKFESSEDEEHVKNTKLEKLESMIQKATALQQEEGEETPVDEVIVEEQDDEIILGVNGDIINRYRIPMEDQDIDKDLAVPEDIDSSKSSEKGNEEQQNQD